MEIEEITIFCDMLFSIKYCQIASVAALFIAELNLNETLFFVICDLQHMLSWCVYLL